MVAEIKGRVGYRASAEGKYLPSVAALGGRVGQGASARLILLQGSARSELQLAPVEDRLEAATARPAAGSKVLASLNLPGRRAVQARFVMP